MPTQAALDLCWAINSASLVNGDDVAPTTPIALESIDEEHLEHFLAEQAESRRVGRYFEHLVHYWLAHVRKVQVVETGLQLRDGKITVGEIDFLYRNEDDELVHCETSVKFFLHLKGGRPSEFPGPNARDNFEAKAAKLFDKQLPASEGRVEGVTIREGLVRGIIFYRRGEIDVASPTRLAPDHQTGLWFRANEMAGLSSFGTDFLVVDKPHWFAPVEASRTMNFVQLHGRLTTHFARVAHPLMLSVRSRSDMTTEQCRCFVVPEGWPEANQPSSTSLV